MDGGDAWEEFTGRLTGLASNSQSREKGTGARASSNPLGGDWLS